jgi:guanine deaminase
MIEEVGFGELRGDAGPPEVGGRDRLIVPAFTDAHMHVPQVDAVGCDGLPLLEWLDRVIFPAEAWWASGGAAASCRTAAERLVREGTAGVAGYLTSHGEASRSALEHFAWRTPLRFHLGRVAMDRNAPGVLTQEDRERQRLSPTPSPVLAGFERGRDGGRVSADSRPRWNVSANPRFAVSCTAELLAEVGWAVSERSGVERSAGVDVVNGEGAYVQTHVSESVAECEVVRELFPSAAHYAGVYDEAGLLGPRTLLAHGVHLSDDEWRLIAERDAVVVHCPGANVFLRSGLFALEKAREFGVRVGLGSDVAAGPDVAMPRVARAMIETSKARQLMGVRGVHVPTPAEVWRMITETNAALLGWPDAGVLREGAMADVLVLRLPESWFDEHLVGRVIYNWSSRLIEARVMDGRRV